MIAIALLLVAAPADVAESVDAQAEHTCDALVTPLAVGLPAPTEAGAAIVERDEVAPPSPALSRIFRPPRPPFG